MISSICAQSDKIIVFIIKIKNKNFFHFFSCKCFIKPLKSILKTDNEKVNEIYQ